MRKITGLAVLALLFGLAPLLDAQAAFGPKYLGPINDTDLAGTGFYRRLNPADVATDLAPDRVETSDDPNALTIQIFREDHGQIVPIEGLNVGVATPSMWLPTRVFAHGLTQAPACPNPGSTVHLIVPIKDERINVTNGHTTYRIVYEAPCRGVIKLFFHSDTNGGQATGIWQIAHRAKLKLAAEIGLDFWDKPITFAWPADGDYYNFGTVHLTRGDHWDVVGHEMGHGIYDLGDLGAFGGGEHKIDQCYSGELALSEGWASFFSGWVSVDLRDPDAKFEFMVPRRAPIRFETIPGDVCKGTKSEWRVNGFFWDLVDLHDDGEQAEYPFRAIWNAMLRSGSTNMEEVRTKLETHGFDPKLIQLVWDLNFNPAVSFRGRW